jgi:hypothetical protein
MGLHGLEQGYLYFTLLAPQICFFSALAGIARIFYLIESIPVMVVHRLYLHVSISTVGIRFQFYVKGSWEHGHYKVVARFKLRRW